MHKLYVPKDGMTRLGTIDLVALLTGVNDVILLQDPIASDATCLFNTENETNKDNTKKIFRRKPTACADDFFFDAKVCKWVVNDGFGSLGTNARNALPKCMEKILNRRKARIGMQVF